MPKICSICQHPQRQQIEQRLNDGMSAAQLAREFSTSPDAILRHRANHMQAPQTLDHSQRLDWLWQQLQATYDHAARQGDIKSSVTVLTKLTSLQAQVESLRNGNNAGNFGKMSREEKLKMILGDKELCQAVALAAWDSAVEDAAQKQNSAPQSHTDVHTDTPANPLNANG